MREGLANLLVSHGMARCRDSGRSMSLSVGRKVVWDFNPQRMTIGWVRFDSFPDYRINAMNPLVLGNDPAPADGNRRICWVNKLKI